MKLWGRWISVLAIASSCVAFVACEDESEGTRTGSLDASVGASSDGSLDVPPGNRADAPALTDAGQDANGRDGREDTSADASADTLASDAAILRVKIDFETVNGVTAGPISGSVPMTARLSDQLQPVYGVTFQSAAKPYVALVRLGQGHATSGVNGIGSVSATDTMAYATTTITFTMPGNPAVAAVTDFVSIRGDQTAISGTATIEAFDAQQVSLGKVTVADKSGGLKLEFQHAGIHSIAVSQVSNTIAYDDLEFGALTPASGL
ncbi:MAG: hypothetical protein SF187_12210 [Deltaproteobacteria bacterium]|nr:hypothetical protein [Deltaproteobacteria bacterium]